jgi:formamidopyrimidine-DNA glycosylase
LPELPEVETTRRGLERSLKGRTISAARVVVPKMVKVGSVPAEEVVSRIVGCRLDDVQRRGKYLILTLDSGYHLLLHLKMRGHLVVQPVDAPDDKYLAVGITFDDALEMRFYDIWTWGEVRLYDGKGLAGHAGLIAMGVEPLSEFFTTPQFAGTLARRMRKPVKAALLDQTTVAGVGNIYADESLFRSGIRPDRPSGALSVVEVDRLRRAIRSVLRDAVASGGTASDEYKNTERQPGAYVPSVYDRGGLACHICGSTLTRTRIGGRGTVYCPKCQS